MSKESVFPSSRGEALGQSETFLNFQEVLSRVAPVDRPVLLIGERGTGKELAASRLHFLSKRWQGPFITLNCATLSPSLIESELFGYEKGAFTGAESRRTGRFEAADGGTLFLDEIGSIPLEAQEKILRVVEYGSFERVGSSRPVEVDVRIVGATNVDLAAMAERKDFKRDLLDRLSFEVLFLPPLRYREEDIMLLASHFATRMSFELGRQEMPTFTETAVRALENNVWKGNIRELKNVVERAVHRSEGGVIDKIVFDPFISPYVIVPAADEENNKKGISNTYSPISNTAGLTLKEAVAELEKEMLQQALSICRHNQKKAAAHLGLTYHQFRGKLRKYSNALENHVDG
ncbi:phage shock protein operon transcriptional activator [Desulfopila sp. IMCC35006]|uniref:phage shock protein operon transcriptional activator n=1 Tax=Desulfopila sp. IMCC35006 TaxID=2569542 RepID=UPI0010AD0742|nr:phage shock protein operon transcriptional activator [Desulfopila sp. IMCC35006]TKB25593.1 phage shock protein operon transcriptional activator [Desulfopila sp. IMCC35006]